MEPGRPALTDIAEQEDLPRAYLEQLVISLRDADLVQSTRGAHGGYELTRPPEQIVMGQVLRALEGPIAPMICVTDDPATLPASAAGTARSTSCGFESATPSPAPWTR